GLTGTDSDDLIVGVKQWQAQQYVRDLSRVTIRGLVSRADTGRWVGGLPPYAYDLQYHESTGKPYQRVRYMPDGAKAVLTLDGTVARTLPRGKRFPAADSDFAKLVPSAPDRVRTVQRIFEMYADGSMGLRSIAATLNSEKIPSPGCANPKSNRDFTWCLSSIRSILQNRAYLGEMAWNRTTQAKFNRIDNGKAEKRETFRRVIEKNREQDWVTVPDAHEA